MIPAQRRYERRLHLRHKINTNAVQAFGTGTLALGTKEATGIAILGYRPQIKAGGFRCLRGHFNFGREGSGPLCGAAGAP